MNNAKVNKNDEIVMRLLHYFITEMNYSPVVLHGAKNEIWLENLDSEYKIVRIVSDYIHNNEQFEFDIFKTKQILGKIKQKTFSLKINALNIFTNLNENVVLNEQPVSNIKCLGIKKISDLKKYNYIENMFPGLSTSKFSEKGMELFIKLTTDINEKTEEDAHMAENVFKVKKPYITYALIITNILMFIFMYMYGAGSEDVETLLKFGANYPAYIKGGEYFRLITSMFLHIGFFHILFNMYALYIIGPQLESFFGKAKYLIIYLLSGITGNLLSNCFFDGVSAGASGAIFGLLGSLLYFGYHYRVYLGNVIKSQIIPLIMINLLIGFTMSGINNAAHIGGLVGGVLATMAVGVKYKSTGFEKVNGYILMFIYTFFIAYIAFFIK